VQFSEQLAASALLFGFSLVFFSANRDRLVSFQKAAAS
jgi:hypothetical protein